MSHVLERENVLDVDCQRDRKWECLEKIVNLDRLRLLQDYEVIQSSDGRK